MELGISRTREILHERRPRRESLYGVLLLENLRLGLGLMVVGMVASTDGDGGNTGAVARSSSRCVDNGGSVAFGHGETKKKKKQICREEESGM